jgi:hypothetical protein
VFSTPGAVSGLPEGVLRFTFPNSSPGASASIDALSLRTTLNPPRSQTGSRPADFVLEQNFPNPFNLGTTITYRLPAVTQVTLVVQDLLGRLITTLVDGFEAEGIHTVRFEADNLASGVYYFTLRAGAFIETRKFIVMK